MNSVTNDISFSKEEALANILPDLENWAKDSTRIYLSSAIEWYLKQIKWINEIRTYVSPTFFSMPFCMDWANFKGLFSLLPTPAYFVEGISFANIPSNISEEESIKYVRNYDAATTFWSHRALYDLLCSETLNQVNERCPCPLFESCVIKTEIDDEYTCKNSPWEISKNEKRIMCPCGMAAHSFGLWQNTLDISFNR